MSDTNRPSVVPFIDENPHVTEKPPAEKLPIASESTDSLAPPSDAAILSPHASLAARKKLTAATPTPAGRLKGKERSD